MTDTPEPTAARAPADPPAVIHLPDLSPRAPASPAKKTPKRQRTHVERFRTDDAEHLVLHDLVRKSGLSFGAFMRARCLGSAGPRSRRQPRLPVVDAREVARNNAELNWIGNNLNQAVRALNEIALCEDRGGLAQMAHLTQPIQRILDELHLTLAANRRALGHDREG